MTEVVRLTLVSHAMTDAMAARRFPADEPLNDIGRRQAEAAAGLDINRGTRQLAGPEQRALQTAELLGLQAVVEPRLA
ncbi:MAG: histidine phosphatase family protein, partial [Mycobacterium sp.]